MEEVSKVRKILITGSAGFLGQNLISVLRRNQGIEILEFDKEDDISVLYTALDICDAVVHLAGENRPDDIDDFMKVNAGLTGLVTSCLEKRGDSRGESVQIIYSSSIQAERDNPYGRSKKAGEQELLSYAEKTGNRVGIFRFPNLFGKWSRPNYNSVVSTFCHNIAHGQEIVISDRNNLLKLAYIDDVTAAIIQELTETEVGKPLFCGGFASYEITLGNLADTLSSFKKMRKNSILPDFANPLTKRLYTTYLSYLAKDDFAYPVEMKRDTRGFLFELLKSKHSGQIFISKTHPGITRGNHFHDSKVEKFCVISGNGTIKFRHILDDKILSYDVNGDNIQVVDIPPGYTHSIKNTGDSEMIVLFWANEIFNPDQPDTYYEEV